MITVVSGKLGAGKSYDCVRRIAEHLARGGCVRTNISLDYKQIGKVVGRRLQSGQIGKLSADDNPTTIPTGDRRGKGTRRTLIVLDEALNWFQSEGKSTNDERKKAWGEWLRQSDKLGQDVWFIAQNFERAAKWIRELAHVSRECFKLEDVKILWVIPFWIFFPPFKRCYGVSVYDVRSKCSLGAEIHRYSKKIYSLYDTSETFGFTGAASAYDNIHLWNKFNPSYLKGVKLCLFLTVPAFVSVIWRLLFV